MNKRNGGLADARNVGLRHVKGTWLCMLDSDDLLGRDYLHRAADLIEEDGHVDIIPGWGFASRWFTRFDSTPTPRGDVRKASVRFQSVYFIGEGFESNMMVSDACPFE